MKRAWLARGVLVAVVAGGLAWFIAANQTTAAGSQCPIYEGSGPTQETQPPAHLLAAQARLGDWLRAEGFAPLERPADAAVVATLVQELQATAVAGLPTAVEVWRGRPSGASTVQVAMHQMEVAAPDGGGRRLYQFSAWVVWEYRGLVWPVRRADRAALAFAERMQTWWRQQPPLVAPTAAEATPAVEGTAAAAGRPAAAALSPVAQPPL